MHNRPRRALAALVTCVTLAVASTAFAFINDFTIDDTAVVSKDGLTVTVSGDIQCLAGDTVEVDVFLNQTSGRLTAAGFGFGFLECDGTVQPWSVLVPTNVVPYKKGPTVAQVNMFDEDDSNFESKVTTIKLHAP